MWDVLEIASDILELACLTDALSPCSVDALSMLDTKSPPVQATSPQQSLLPFILTLDLHKKS